MWFFPPVVSAALLYLLNEITKMSDVKPLDLSTNCPFYELKINKLKSGADVTQAISDES